MAQSALHHIKKKTIKCINLHALKIHKKYGQHQSCRLYIVVHTYTESFIHLHIYALINLLLLLSNPAARGLLPFGSVTYRVFLNHWSIIDLYCGRNFDYIVSRLFAMCSHGSGNFSDMSHMIIGQIYFFVERKA